MTCSISARQRWCRSHTAQKKLEDVTADLKKRYIKESSSQLQTFLDFPKRNINPFDSNLNQDYLYNISRGLAAPEIDTEDLLHAEEKGEKKRLYFIVKYSEDA